MEGFSALRSSADSPWLSQNDMHEYALYQVMENVRTETFEAGVKDTYKQHDNDIISERHKLRHITASHTDYSLTSLGIFFILHHQLYHSRSG